MTTYTQNQVLEILNAANQDGCFEDEAEYLFEKLGQEFHTLIEGTWAQVYLEELGLDLACPPWKQQQDKETAQIQEWYSQYPEMVKEWETSICKALLAGEYEVQEGYFWEQERVGTQQIQVCLKYFVVDGVKHFVRDYPYSHFNWCEKWVNRLQHRNAESQKKVQQASAFETAKLLEGQHGDVKISVYRTEVTASVTFPIKEFKACGKELEDNYTVSKDFSHSTPLETILAEIRAKAEAKKVEKLSKYTENKARYEKAQGSKLKEQELYDRLVATGKADGFRMEGGRLEKLSTWKAKGGMRSNWCHIDAVDSANKLLGVRSKPVIKPKR